MGCIHCILNRELVFAGLHCNEIYEVGYSFNKFSGHTSVWCLGLVIGWATYCCSSSNTYEFVSARWWQVGKNKSYFSSVGTNTVHFLYLFPSTSREFFKLLVDAKKQTAPTPSHSFFSSSTVCITK